jgi:hypothetical protein
MPLISLEQTHYRKKLPASVRQAIRISEAQLHGEERVSTA